MQITRMSAGTLAGALDAGTSTTCGTVCARAGLASKVRPSRKAGIILDINRVIGSLESEINFRGGIDLNFDYATIVS
jgi:hypothetical protein